MEQFNIAWLISKRQFHSLMGVEADTFLKSVDRLRLHWRERMRLRRTVPGVRRSSAGSVDPVPMRITQGFMACLYRTDK